MYFPLQVKSRQFQNNYTYSEILAIWHRTAGTACGPHACGALQYEARFHPSHCPNQQPIRDTTSRIPAKLMPALKQGVEDMLALGVIEPSRVEWCSRVVVVLRLENAKYLTTFDLCKGY